MSGIEIPSDLEIWTWQSRDPNFQSRDPDFLSRDPKMVISRSWLPISRSRHPISRSRLPLSRDPEIGSRDLKTGSRDTEIKKLKKIGWLIQPPYYGMGDTKWLLKSRNFIPHLMNQIRYYACLFGVGKYKYTCFHLPCCLPVPRYVVNPFATKHGNVFAVQCDLISASIITSIYITHSDL